MPSTNSDSPIWALVDCNNFYASCEKLFRPDLQGRPVVVLSNNDGCIIARSREAKAIGVPMGKPWFQIRPLLHSHDAAVFSANFALYGDLSNRVMEILERLAPHVEQYSIDEAFLRLERPIARHLPEFCRHLRQTVQKWTGIPVSIGIGQSPTLAKLANHIAKKNERFGGSYSLFRPESQIDAWLANTPVEEIWGIGKRHAKKLNFFGVKNALQLKTSQDAWVMKNLTITGLQTVWELRGITCQSTWINSDWKRKTVLHSRSFGNRVHGLEELCEAISVFTARCAERLRMMNLLAGGIWVRIRTSPHDGVYHAASASSVLKLPSDDTGLLIAEAKKIARNIYVPGHPYAKAAVMFFDLVDKSRRQLNLFEKPEHKSRQLMAALDAVNRRYGRLALRYGAMGLHKADWHMRQNMRSPAYTSSWDELPAVSCR